MSAELVNKQSVEDDSSNQDSAGYSIGLASSVGFISGQAFTAVPAGASAIITTPLGFNIGALTYKISFILGSYTGQYDSRDDDEYDGPDSTVILDDFNPMLLGIGGNLKLANLIFPEEPKLKTSGLIKADIATKTAAKPTKLWKPATNSGIAVIGILNAMKAPIEPPISKKRIT